MTQRYQGQSSAQSDPDEERSSRIHCGLQPASDFHPNKSERSEPRHVPKPKNERGWRKIVRNFTPSWFAVIMGTGIVSILLHNLPYNGDWLYWISVAIFALNVVLFLLFTFISIVRYTVYPEIWFAMIRHPAQSLFIGTFPMGLATIINMIVFVCVPAWGYGFVQLAWGLWWIDVVISLACCFYMPFVIMYVHTNQLSTMTAAWLLPIVAPIVASASGSIVASVLPNPQHALWTIIISYILWGTGVPLAMAVLVIYFQRLTLHALPPREVIVSVFLPLGPLGQGGFAIMNLGSVAVRVFAKTGTLQSTTTNSAEILYVLGWLVATIMWGFGLVWLFFAAASITRSKFPFNMGWWGFTFPLGVFTTSTTQMAKELPSTFFKVLGTIFSVAVTLLWVMVAVRTVKRAATGEMFFAPCLKDLDGKKAEAERNCPEGISPV
ncbi:C4-dicarboxylate transporter/malic acid transport protein-like protein [Stipitochalara longipes BDJ]|nr:C4-dicarboxylate transporter/malic acid transport protein-like protein [Stipitochalara longipes BDJ]